MCEDQFPVIFLLPASFVQSGGEREEPHGPDGAKSTEK